MPPPAAAPDLALTYCRMIAQTLALDEAGLVALVAGTGVDVPTLQDSDGYIDWHGAARLMRNARQLAASGDIALQTGLRALPAMHGPMGVAAMASPTLRDAMAVFARYNNTRTGIFTAELMESEDSLTMQLHFAYPMDEAVQFLTESALASAFACHSMLLGRPLSGGVVQFNYPAPDYAEAFYSAFAGNQVRFDAPAPALCLPARYGDEPLASHDRDMMWLASQQCEARQEALRRRGRYCDEVLALLTREPAVAGMLPGLVETAAALNISPRTLIRRLKEEGTRFQQLRDQALSRQATRLLGLPQYTVAAVAEALGYTDVASFRRAFRRWFGTSPAAFRGRDV
ncbi:AraC family transcriptional regulator [Alcanivorax limicola]|uniref:AraC family transcriptional regulator n=1 Tax=Alcanivorax limicola TaxID=2874102 RepID=UPI001CBFCE89|nr:AraC family transcriptional regulator [Alcanivorax limicola]